MMRRWLKGKQLVNNFMVEKGFIYNERYKWWFHNIQKVAVSNEDATKYSIESIEASPYRYKIRSITFLASKKLNQDILDTIYLKHYENQL